MKHLRQLKPTRNHKQLICFPFAGGYSASFRPLSQFLQSDWGMIVAELPGHGTNRSPLMNVLRQLVDLYVQELSPLYEHPFALFGHSMGGILVYEITQRLEQKGIFPEKVIISGTNPPHTTRQNYTHLDDESFLSYIISLGGLPNELLQEKELLQLFLPVLRNDFQAIEGHFFENQYRIETPVTFFSSKLDSEATSPKMQGWDQYVKKAQFYEFEGGHMFPLTHSKEVASKIREILK